MPYITTADGQQLYYKDWGAGRPVILIHGWPLSADSWDDHAIALANAGMRVISYDRRGFGRSSQPWGGYDYNTLADDLASVIEHTQAKDAAIIGFSMGGGEVVRYLSRHGRKSVVQAGLIASVVPYLLKTDTNPEGVSQSVFEEIDTQIRKDRAHFFNGFFKDFFGTTMLSHPVSDETLQWARNVAMQASLQATLSCANSFATTDFRQELATLDGLPTLVIHGTADKTVPIDATARIAARAILSAQLIEYEGAPHGLFATHKNKLAEDLINFLAR